MHHPRITATLDLTEREWVLIRDALQHFPFPLESPAAAWQHYKVHECVGAVLQGESSVTTSTKHCPAPEGAGPYGKDTTP